MIFLILFHNTLPYCTTFPLPHHTDEIYPTSDFSIGYLGLVPCCPRIGRFSTSSFW